MLTGVKREFLHGTMEAKLSVLHLLMSLHLKYSEERSVVLHIREAVMHLMKTGPWTARNLCVKVVCVLYTQDEDRMYFVQQGLLDALLGIVANKSKDLQEAPIVCYLYLCVHPDIPKIMLEKGIGKMVAELLYCEEPIIKELAVIVLKALNLYDGDAVDAVVPEDKKYLMKKDPYNPHLYGSEYGGMIQEYLQTIVENRRENKYLLDSFTDEEVQAMGLTEDQLKLYENTFMELDADCGGSLDLDELKMLMVLMGEEMDADELQEVLDQYDTDKSGELDFKEFVVMMQGWSTRFGTGITKLFNTTTKRGAIGRARRDYDRWWNRNKIEAVQVADARNQKVVKMNLGEELKLRYLPHEELLLRRERETRMREMGISYSRNYSNRIVYHGPAGDYKFKKSKRGLRVILPPMGYQRSVSSVPNTPTSRISDGTF